MEWQIVAAAIGTPLQVAKGLAISGYELVNASDIEELIGKCVTEASVYEMIDLEEHNEEKQQEEEAKMSQPLAS